MIETTIYWELVEWTEPAENLASLKGSDSYGNEYSAGALMATEDEIDKLYDIEITKQNFF